MTITLDAKGPGEVHASDVQTPSEVDIVNPDLYLFTISENGHVRMDMSVEQGKGYIPAEQNKHEGQPIGVIPIDAIYSPVLKANFVVEKTRVGQATDYERLLLEVVTDGTLTAEEAVSGAAQLFTQHLELFSKFGESIEAHEAAVNAQQQQGPEGARDPGRGARPSCARLQLPQGQRHHHGAAAPLQEGGRAAQPAQLRPEVARRDQRKSWSRRASSKPEQMDTVFQ